MSTVVELKKLAKSMGITGYSKMKKAQLLKAVGKSGSPKKRSPKRRSPKRRSPPKRKDVYYQSPVYQPMYQTPFPYQSPMPSAPYNVTLTFRYVRTSSTQEPDPTPQEIDNFIRTQTFPELVEYITDFSKVAPYKLSAYDFNLSGRTFTFKIPSIFPMSKVQEYVKNLNEESLEDMFYEALPGKGFVLASKYGQNEIGVIDYRGTVRLF